MNFSAQMLIDMGEMSIELHVLSHQFGDILKTEDVYNFQRDSEKLVGSTVKCKYFLKSEKKIESLYEIKLMTVFDLDDSGVY